MPPVNQSFALCATPLAPKQEELATFSLPRRLGESLFVRHCCFTGGNDPSAPLKKALKADIDEDAWATLYRTTSRPFAEPGTGRIAVRVTNDYGNEVMKGRM